MVVLGQKNRAVSATAMNAESSRSHSILTIVVERTDRAEAASGDGEVDERDMSRFRA